MADENGAPHPVESDQASVSIKSPAKAPPPKPAFKDPGASSSKVKITIDTPKRPRTTTELPEQTTTDTMAIGNKEYEMMLTIEHRLGVFYKRSKTEDMCKWATLNADNFRTSITATLDGVLRRCLYQKGIESDDNVDTRVTRVVRELVTGICMMTYTRLRTVNFAFDPEGDRYMLKPKTPSPLEIPLPYAIAIQQLGAIEIVSLPNRTIAYPTLTEADAAAHLLPDGVRFRPTNYAQAVEYCKSIGMHFAPVDHNLKCGSAWWLLAGQEADGTFQLKCPVPESNFTEQDGLIHLMFCATAASTFGTTLFTLGDLDVGNYGSMLRNPHDDANINSYFSYDDESNSQFWKTD